jgi:hypothetical protein
MAHCLRMHAAGASELLDRAFSKTGVLCGLGPPAGAAAADAPGARLVGQSGWFMELEGWLWQLLVLLEVDTGVHVGFVQGMELLEVLPVGHIRLARFALDCKVGARGLEPACDHVRTLVQAHCRPCAARPMARHATLVTASGFWQAV